MVEVRPPEARDAAGIWQLVAGTDALDSNSSYAYLLLCTHFADTGVVAHMDGRLVGFVLGYVPPDDPDTAFVWQVAVAEAARGRGLGAKLLDAWFDRCSGDSGPRYVEATVTPSNDASRALFASFGDRHGAPVEERLAFPTSFFPADESHEEEISIRIGPVRQDEDLPSITPGEPSTMEVIDRLESDVRSYCRSFPVVFDTARGARLTDTEGRTYIDFFAGAGALNYGHNDPKLKQHLLAYLARDGITHGLDMATVAKAEFLERFEDRILVPRNLDYKVQFPGPTGTNAVETALKLARKVTGREGVVSFTNAFHGMTLGSLAVTGNGFKRRGAGVPLHFGDALPFDGFLGEGVDTLDILEAMLEDDGSGIDPPAAVIVETTQAEGGLNVASVDWLRRLEGLCRRFGSLLIVDDIQVGIGRTGPFFSFERADLQPDIVCLSKSLSGYGLPLAVVLIRPDLDVWEPGEHNGTFRGNNPAFVTATAALDYWRDDRLTQQVEEKARTVRASLEAIAERHGALQATVRGIGLLQGLAFEEPSLAGRVSRAAFERGLVLETAGPEGGVAKIMPPLTIDEVGLKDGLELLSVAVDDVAREGSR